jgi:Cu+-exporting ATPase
VVLVLAVLTFIVWMLFDSSGGISRAFAVSVAVLVIACPCAMGLAVPAALTVAIGRGAQLGVLFKGGESLERLARVDTVVFDKTGTLTAGKPEITAIHPAAGVNDSQLLSVAAALEQQSEHPLAHAVMDKAGQAGLSFTSAAESKTVPGKGITGRVDGVFAAAGNGALMRQLQVAFPENVTSGATMLHIAMDQKYLGHLEAQDVLRTGAREAVLQLASLGFDTVMLTGDSREAALPIAAQVGIDRVIAGVLPDSKLAEIRKLQAGGKKVAMVGDGINDAAALAQADAGLAIGTGTDLAREAGDAILLRGEPQQIVDAIQLAQQTLRIMRQNLGWALGYNLLGIPVAAGVLYPLLGVLLSPALAAAAMALSSVSVLSNSLRLRRFQPL